MQKSKSMYLEILSLHVVVAQQTFVLMETSWKRLEDFFRLCPQNTSWRRLQGVLVKTNIFVLAIRLHDVFKISWRRLAKMLSRRLLDVLQKRLPDVLKTSSKRLQDIFKTSWKTSSRHLQDVLPRYLQDVFKKYYQVKLFWLTSLWEAFNTLLRHSFPKTVIFNRGICLGNTISDKSTSDKFARDNNFSSFIFTLFYTFSWQLREAYLEPGRTSIVQ